MYRMDHHAPDQQVRIVALQGNGGASGIAGYQAPMGRCSLQSPQQKAPLVHGDHDGARTGTHTAVDHS